MPLNVTCLLPSRAAQVPLHEPSVGKVCHINFWQGRHLRNGLDYLTQNTTFHKNHKPRGYWGIFPTKTVNDYFVASLKTSKG